MKAIITVGIPGCGKSTWAASKKDFLEINLDECRRIVSGDSLNQTSTPDAVKLRDQLIGLAAINGQSIIISDTNLNDRFRIELEVRLRGLGFEVIEAVFLTPLHVCLERNRSRSRVVPDQVLERMHSTLVAQKFDADVMVDEQGLEYSKAVIVDLIKYKAGEVPSDLLSCLGCVIGSDLTNAGHALWEFACRNYGLTGFNPRSVLSENTKNTHAPNDIMELSRKTGLPIKFLEEIEAYDPALFDPNGQSHELYRRILSKVDRLVA